MFYWHKKELDNLKEQYTFNASKKENLIFKLNESHCSSKHFNPNYDSTIL